jgi:hypothetical protein
MKFNASVYEYIIEEYTVNCLMIGEQINREIENNRGD